MTEALRTLIVDDEPLAIERLQILCARVPRITLVGTAGDGATALRLVQRLRPDLILLDIQMPRMGGMALARALEEEQLRPALIFVTAFDSFAVAAFDMAATDYLLKPVEADRFERAIARIGVTIAAAPPGERAPAAIWAREFWVPHRGSVIRLKADEIELVEAERDYMRLHVGTRSYLLHETISALERKLDPSVFLRLHRSTIVRRDQIAGFRYTEAGAWEAELRNGKRVRVGRTYLANARKMVEGGE